MAAPARAKRPGVPSGFTLKAHPSGHASFSREALIARLICPRVGMVYG